MYGRACRAGASSGPANIRWDSRPHQEKELLNQVTASWEYSNVVWEETRHSPLMCFYITRSIRMGLPAWPAVHRSSSSICYLAAMVGRRGCLYLKQHGKEDHWGSSPCCFDSEIIPFSTLATRKITVMWGLLPYLPPKPACLCQNLTEKKWKQYNKTLLFLK